MAIFIYGFKKLKIGTIVGAKTAGAVVAGRVFLLSNDDVLYLAVRDVSVDGMRLEGNGVKLDIIVDRSLMHSVEGDSQLQKAKVNRVRVKLIRNSKFKAAVP